MKEPPSHSLCTDQEEQLVPLHTHSVSGRRRAAQALPLWSLRPDTAQKGRGWRPLQWARRTGGCDHERF